MMYGKVQEKRYISNLTDGKKYLAEMDYKKAEESFNEAVSVEPRKIDAYQGLADTYEGLEDYDRMFDSYRKGISIVNQNYKEQGSMTKEGEQFYNNAIDSYVEQGNDEEAKDLIEQMQNMISDEKGGTRNFRTKPFVAWAVSCISVFALADGVKRRGENTSAQGHSSLVIRSRSVKAATIEEVIPHFSKPVATNQFGVGSENCPI